MIIKQESIIDFKEKFELLEKSMAGLNYVVSLDGRTFTFEPDKNPFNISCLRKIYYDSVLQTASNPALNYQNLVIEGTIAEYSFTTCIEEINKAICCLDGLHYPGSKLSPIGQAIQAITTNMQTFWQIVQQHFTITRELQVLIHHPNWGSFFKTGMMWEFCFIFINNETNQGLVLSGSAFD